MAGPLEMPFGGQTRVAVHMDDTWQILLNDENGGDVSLHYHYCSNLLLSGSHTKCKSLL